MSSHAKLTPHEVAQYREVLQNLIGRLTGEVAQLRDEALGPGNRQSLGTVPTDTDHQGDAGTHEAEEARALTLLGTEEQVLGEARAALTRIDQGSFGRCTGCGQPIARARLKALPYTRYCIECARANEARS